MALVRLIRVPYDSAHRDARMGRGPGRFVSRGVVERLRAAGHDVRPRVVDPRAPFPTEVHTAFEVMGGVAEEVRAAVAAGEFPLVLAGNCNTAVGSIAALGEGGTIGIVWLDAHADFNTPETTESGFLDGMALATVTGRCWHAMSARIPGFRPVAEDRIAILGLRDVDPSERELLEWTRVARVTAASVREGGGARAVIDPVLAGLRGRVARIYLHIDLDVHDPAEAPANAIAPPEGGLTREDVREIVRLVKDRFVVAGAALTAYDPSVDPGDHTLRAGLDLCELIAGA